MSVCMLESGNLPFSLCESGNLPTHLHSFELSFSPLWGSPFLPALLVKKHIHEASVYIHVVDSCTLVPGRGITVCGFCSNPAPVQFCFSCFGSWSFIHHLPSSRLCVVLFVPRFIVGLLWQFTIAFLLIAFGSTMPLVGTLVVAYVGVDRQFETGMFLLRSQALLETMLAQMDDLPPSR